MKLPADQLDNCYHFVTHFMFFKGCSEKGINSVAVHPRGVLSCRTLGNHPPEFKLYGLLLAGFVKMVVVFSGF